MRVLVVLLLALPACTLNGVQPHDMGDPAPDLAVVDMIPPRDGPVATVNLPGCSATMFSASSRR